MNITLQKTNCMILSEIKVLWKKFLCIFIYKFNLWYTVQNGNNFFAGFWIATHLGIPFFSDFVTIIYMSSIALPIDSISWFNLSSVRLWYSGYHYCKNSFNKAWTGLPIRLNGLLVVNHSAKQFFIIITIIQW